MALGVPISSLEDKRVRRLKHEKDPRTLNPVSLAPPLPHSGRPATALRPPPVTPGEFGPRPLPRWVSVSSCHLGCNGLFTMERDACAGAAMMVIISWSLQEAKPLCFHLPGEMFWAEPWAGPISDWRWSQVASQPACGHRFGQQAQQLFRCQLTMGSQLSQAPAEAAGRPGSPGAGQASPLHTAWRRGGGPKSKVNFLCGLRQVLSLSGPQFPFCKGPRLQAADEK